MKIWEYFTRLEVRPAWSRDKTFSAWATPYLSALLDLIV